MWGYFSEGVSLLITMKAITAAVPYFYGSPVGYLAFAVILFMVLAVWLLIVKLTEGHDEFGATKNLLDSATSGKGLVVLAGSIALIGIPVAVQWKTFTSPAQLAHSSCVINTFGLQTNECFANWVKQNQKVRKAS